MFGGIIDRCSSKPALRKKQYKALRDVMCSQGYAAAAVTGCAIIACDYGTDIIVKGATASAVASLTPFGAAVVAGKALTVGRKVGKVYRVGTKLYNMGMLPFKTLHLVAQTPWLAIDYITLGEPYVPRLDAKWWHLGNITADAEDMIDYVKPTKF